MRNKIYRRKRANPNIPLKTLPELQVPHVLMMTTFPPRQCGIATYTADLIQAIRQKFNGTFEIQIAALENQSNSYGPNVQHVLETEDAQSYTRLAKQIRNDDRIKLVVLQHEFGLFINFEEELLQLLAGISKKTVVAFHTVLPDPDPPTKRYIQNIAELAQAFIVMTSDAAKILQRDYHVSDEKIRVIPHGTHLVKHTEKTVFKEKYGYSGRKVLSTFGLLSSGKSIETTLLALPKIIEVHPEVMFLIMGKTHPSVVQHEGEKYRDMLLSMIDHLNLKDHVTFINQYLPLSSLLEYLQLTDIYLFTSSDPQQAVSGTFSYAMSCGCPVISTPIPHAREVLKNDSGLIIDFGDSENLALHVNILLKDEPLRNRISLNALHLMASTAWENSAIAHVQLFKEVAGFPPKIKYRIPEISLDHINHMTTPFGIIQFAVLDQPETLSGYTLDDNARALIAMAKHYSIFGSGTDLMLIKRYLNFIAFCSQNDGRFLNYVDISKNFTEQNNECNLDDSTGRAIWALGYLLSLQHILPGEIITEAQRLFNKSVVKSDGIHSTRAMAFIIKGLYYANLRHANPAQLTMIEQFADRLVQMFRHEADSEWKWFESYLTYANSLIPEAMLMAWKSTQKEIYRTIALSSFNFLLSKIFAGDRIAVISNKGWMHYGRQTDSSNKGGEQAIDVAYTVMALSEFYDTFKNETYREMLVNAFTWFLGNNHLKQTVYNPITGGCYDGVEDSYINLNQGAESTVSYLMARLTVEHYTNESATQKLLNGAELAKYAESEINSNDQYNYF